ncbi:MAG: hypothetical protein K2J20_03180, partial [Bacilli bacterium]|nr:hypothetical protein [Bacilli bacterium]
SRGRGDGYTRQAIHNKVIFIMIINFVFLSIFLTFFTLLFELPILCLNYNIDYIRSQEKISAISNHA